MRYCPGGQAGQDTQVPGFVPPHCTRYCPGWHESQYVQVPGFNSRQLTRYCPAAVQVWHAVQVPGFDPLH
eukprot:2965653-Rhodomonas_salina.1